MIGYIASWIAAAAAIAVVVFPTTVESFPTHVCATNAPAQDTLDLKSTSVDVGSNPWGLVYLNEKIAFASVNLSLGVLDVSDFTPKLKALLPLPTEFGIGDDDVNADGYGFRGVALTHDKRNLYIATGYGAVIFDVPKAILGRNDSIVGVLSQNGYAGRSSIELSITPDDKYVFISQEFGSNATYNLGAVEVYNVTRLNNGTVVSSCKGFIALGYATIGQQFSKDYTKLFVTSELNNTATSLNQTSGIISVLDVEKLKQTPGKSLLNKVSSGCHPVRCQLSTDGTQLWVSLREANQVLAYDAEKIINSTTDVLLATVNTGTSPIGLAAIGSHILTVDSNRFYYDNTSTGVTVVDTVAAVEQGQVDFPQIPTGAFPRALAVSPDGNTLLISEYDDSTIRAVDVRSLNNFQRKERKKK
ncbi:cytochrome cd1-nitrite reductase-like protein [Xylariales sp. AK1849]|nr:cytochrome cd1-nitrite reductase-like protein [Xylariales sp. AK1849]